MVEFLSLLTKFNLAMSAAIVVVWALRRPVRAAFHSSVAYGLWLLVPAMSLASLLPAPVGMPVPLMAKPVVTAWAPVSIASTKLVAAAWPASPMDENILLFALWILGAVLMALYFAALQARFAFVAKMGQAGPAVVGFFRPHLVMPDNFEMQFGAEEREAILAHERAHLARQDARVNAAVALLRCLCWFNPLVHFAAGWLRRDQELACDLIALRCVSRRDYANALFKSQTRVIAVPLGCAWPGSEHPLTERVALLKRQLPTAVRTRIGMSLVVALATFAGMAAWAAEPPQSASSSHHFVGMIFYARKSGPSEPAPLLTLEADKQGHATLHFPYGEAHADSASYDFRMDQDMSAHKTFALIGNVVVTYGDSGIDGLHGQKLVFDARTGMLDLDGKTMPSGMPKYVPCTRNCSRLTRKPLH